MAVRYTPFKASGSPQLPPNQTMSPGQYLKSSNGRFRLILQADGNLVIKDGEAIVWTAGDKQPYSVTLYPKKCVSLYNLSLATAAFFMIRPDGVYGSPKVPTVQTNLFGSAPA
ncbi:hypothetical protein [Pseudomonas sp. Z4-7]|uniref:hypothetical protein n=1 Tax=Pseudomonas sp. Z4-7 TaxID=2817413 RepID=UPI003DA82DA9